MGMGSKIWFVIATVLVIAGLIMFTVAMSEYGWDFSRLSTEKFETNTYDINEVFHSISMNTDTADIIFAASQDGTCRVECYEAETAKHSVSVQEDTLVIKIADEKAWYNHIGINFDSPKVTVYLPKTEYASLFIHESTGDIEIPEDFKFTCVDISLSTGDVNFLASASELIKIRGGTGNICVENTSAGSLSLSVSTGKITVSNVTCQENVHIRVSTGKTNLTDMVCKNLVSSGNTGDIALDHVIVSEKLSIQRSTGDVKLDSSDAAEILIKTDTGDVVGSLLTGKVFITHTDTGSVEVPKTATGGKCEITTDTGNIKIKVS